jgi:hypothetical protein
MCKLVHEGTAFKGFYTRESYDNIFNQLNEQNQMAFDAHDLVVGNAQDLIPTYYQGMAVNYILRQLSIGAFNIYAYTHPHNLTYEEAEMKRLQEEIRATEERLIQPQPEENIIRAQQPQYDDEEMRAFLEREVVLHDVTQTLEDENRIFSEGQFGYFSGTETLTGRIQKSFQDFNKSRITNIKKTFQYDDESVIKELPQSILKVLDILGQTEFCTREPVQRLFQTSLGIILENIEVESLNGGFVSGEIYHVTGHIEGIEDRKEYFIKYLRSSLLIDKKRTHDEPLNLYYIQNLIDDGILNVDSFVLNLPLATYKYRISGQKKLFTISEGAKGKSLTKIVKEGDPETIYAAFEAIGKALGAFHMQNFHIPAGMEFPTSKHDFNSISVPCHGDFHGDNLFYCPYEDLVTFIDNETLMNSFNEESETWDAPLFYDFGYLLHSSEKRFGKSGRKFLKNHQYAPFNSLIDHYIEAFDVENRQGIVSYLSSCLKNINEINFQDVFRKVLGRRIKYNKKIDNKFSKKVISSLQKNLEKYIQPTENNINILEEEIFLENLSRRTSRLIFDSSVTSVDNSTN